MQIQQIIRRRAEVQEINGNIVINTDHSVLKNRDLPNQHPISAIEGLQEELNSKAGISDIPTELSQLNEDSEHRVVSDEEKANWNNKAETSDIPTNVSELNNDSNYQTNTEVANAIAVETTNRENADLGLQNQIDAITNANDVVDVLSTYQELLSYDTQHLKNNDIIKVMQDSTHDDAISYFKWVIVDNVGSWSYVGSQGPFYTKSETDIRLNQKQNLINSESKLNSSLVDDTNSTNKFVSASEKSQIAGAEQSSNKVTTISSSSTDTQYPSALSVYNYIQSLDGSEVDY